jgi:hypothetical protein
MGNDQSERGRWGCSALVALLEERSAKLWVSLQANGWVAPPKNLLRSPNHIIKRGKAVTGCADSLVAVRSLL